MQASGTHTSRGCGPVRPSRRGRWRALSLVLVHVAAAAHVAHWYVSGRTLTPVEPSEGIQTISEGIVNAGFVLFVALIAGTAVFGRFFCGWACHIVALQDACTWLLRRLRIRPRPFRSRLLKWVPLGALLWMFAGPAVARWWLGAGPPELRAGFVSDDFWGRFPGPAVAFATFAVCGFLIVYVLGNKGFCSYACPYGGIFGVVDRLAPGKIRVTDACEGCGHCTATCTSNVRVHREVREHGMVTDPGCMKCLDCVSVCPNDALYFGFGAPTVAGGAPRAELRPIPHDYSWREEIGLGAAFVVSLLALTGLYGAIPLLLALGLAAISSFVLVTAYRGFVSDRLRFARVVLKNGGQWTGAGAVFLSGVAVWLLVLGHSAGIQVANRTGARALGAALVDQAGGRTAHAARGFETARDRLALAERYGLVRDPNLLARLGSAHAHLGEHAAAEAWYGRAVAAAPRFAAARYELARYALARGNVDRAIRQLEHVVRDEPELPQALETLTDLLLDAGRVEEARTVADSLVRRRPHSPAIRVSRAAILARSGDEPAALADVEIAVEAAPRHPRARFALAQHLAKAGRFEEAFTACETAVRLGAVDQATHRLCARLALRLGDAEGARRHLEAAGAGSSR